MAVAHHHRVAAKDEKEVIITSRTLRIAVQQLLLLQLHVPLYSWLACYGSVGYGFAQGSKDADGSQGMDPPLLLLHPFRAPAHLPFDRTRKCDKSLYDVARPILHLVHLKLAANPFHLISRPIHRHPSMNKRLSPKYANLPVRVVVVDQKNKKQKKAIHYHHRYGFLFTLRQTILRFHLVAYDAIRRRI